MKNIYVHPKAYAKVDDSDYDELSKHKWYLSTKGYAIRNGKAGEAQKTYRMHRELMGSPKGLQIDHINRDKLDNRKENLRAVTNGENRINSKINKNNTSGYRNIFIKKDKYNTYYVAYARRNGEKMYKNHITLKDALLTLRSWGIA